jgi:hypothetical protein
MAKVLKPVNAGKNPGLAKLPKPVRNKMGYQKDGGKSALGMKSVKAGYDSNPGVTRADIIVAAKKEAKYGKEVKKAQVGVKLRGAQYKRLGRLAAKDTDRAEKVAGRMVERATRKERGKEYVKKNISSLMPKSKGGSKLKKQAAIAIAMKKAGKSPKKAMGGMKMGKCKYGCK